MCYAAKAALLLVNVDTRSHAGLLNQFSQHIIKTGQVDKKYGRMLALVMQAREASDYSPEINISHENTTAIVSDAEDFISEIKAFLKL